MSHAESPRIGQSSRIELLIAVGHNDSASVLEVLQASKELRSEIAEMDIRVVLWPSKFPTEPGIYLFSGNSSVECIVEDDEEEHDLQETLHRCSYRKLEYRVKLHGDAPKHPRPYLVSDSDYRRLGNC